MTQIKISSLHWNERNLEHITKHSVTREEVEEAICHILAHRQGYAGRIVLIGRSAKRLLSVIVSKETSGRYYIVTARDADKKERKLVYAKESA